MLMTSERPADAADRAVPGDWATSSSERHQSAIATPVERSTRYLLLAHLPNGNTNGLLGQYCPKGTDLRHYTAKDITSVATELDDPWKSPFRGLQRSGDEGT